MNDEHQVGLVNHIFYADDALLFCDASPSQVRSLAAALICFECVTGLKVNWHKSTLIPVGEVSQVGFLADILGCEVEVLPSSYLGLPLGARGCSTAVWEPVIRNVERKVESWKAKLLSFGARVVMIKSVLSSLPVYYLSILKAPLLVIERIEGLQKRFLWSGNRDKDKIHWVAWELVKTPKRAGGLGVHDLKVLNEALLSKWMWRYAVERDAWWRVLLTSKCGVGCSEWLPTWNLGSAGCSLWRWVISVRSLFWAYGYLDPGGEVLVLFGLTIGLGM
ncbi:Putative ribonuclease H protein At1g65750 [Linum grandiflorum]